MNDDLNCVCAATYKKVEAKKTNLLFAVSPKVTSFLTLLLCFHAFFQLVSKICSRKRSASFFGRSIILAYLKVIIVIFCDTYRMLVFQ